MYQHIPCRYFNTSSGCLRGQQCWYRHDSNISNPNPPQEFKTRPLIDVLNAKQKEREALKAKEYKMYAFDLCSLTNELIQQLNDSNLNVYVENILNEYVVTLLIIVHKALVLLWRDGPDYNVYSILLSAFVNLGFTDSCFTEKIIQQIKDNLNKSISHEQLANFETENAIKMQSIIDEYKSQIEMNNLSGITSYNLCSLSMIFYSNNIDRLKFDPDEFENYVCETDEFDCLYIATMLIVSMQKPVKNAHKIWNYLTKIDANSEWEFDDIDYDARGWISVELVNYINSCKLSDKSWKCKYSDKLFDRLIRKLGAIHNENWEIMEHRSLLKNITINPTTTETETLLHQYNKLELNKFNQWKDDIWKLFITHMDHNAFMLTMSYCEREVAYYYCISKKKESNSFIEANWIWMGDVLRCKIPTYLRDMVKFGDIVEADAGYKECGVYIVSNVEKNSLILVGKDGSGEIYIPKSITDELCDPIEFYRFCSPTQALPRPYQWCMEFSFSHGYIQQILGIHSYKNTSNHNYALYRQWTFQVNLQEYSSFDAKDFESCCAQVEFNIRSGCEISMTVPINYAKSKNKPLIYYVEKLYNKHLQLEQLKQNIGEKIAELSEKIKQNIVMINALVENDRSGCNKFEIELKTPLTWCLDYPSTPFFTFKGLLFERDKMITFIENVDYIHIGYSIKIEYGNNNREKAKFCDFISLIMPPHYPTSWTDDGYSIVTSTYIHIATAILNGMKLYEYSKLKWKILNQIITLKEYENMTKTKCDNNLGPYLIYDNIKCTKLVKYLILVYTKARKRYRNLSSDEYQAIMKSVHHILD